MFGLPGDFDGSFLIGRSLLQICIGLHEVIFRFDANVEITTESNFRVAIGDDGRVFSSPPEGGAASLELLQENVTDAGGTEDGTLTLSFPSGSLQFYDSSRNYESYQIRHDDRLYVV